MVRHTLEILQYLLQDFQSVSDDFTTLRNKGLIAKSNDMIKSIIYMNLYIGVQFQYTIVF